MSFPVVTGNRPESHLPWNGNLVRDIGSIQTQTLDLVVDIEPFEDDLAADELLGEQRMCAMAMCSRS
jgi:hypothetical protein